MKILYLCMGSIFKTFYDLDKKLKNSINIESSFFVTEPSFSENFIKKNNIDEKRIIKE